MLRDKTVQITACIVMCCLMIAVGCETQNTPQKPSPKPKISKKTQPTDSVLPAPKLPPKGTTHAPSFITMAKGEKYNAKVMLDSASCTECHKSIVGEWKESMHALGSLNNPLYRLSFEDFSKASGKDKLNFCGGCHDVAMVMDGTLTKDPVDPNNASTHAGITCNACHGVTQATVEGNASFVLSTKPVPKPIDGDAASLKAHKAHTGQAVLKTNALCVSCHRGFFSPDTGHEVSLAGLMEWSSWRGSGYNGDQSLGRIDPFVKQQDCVSCHMPKTTEGHRSHRFPGGHTTFAKSLSKAQFDANEVLLKNSATVDIQMAPVMNTEGKANTFVDVIVFNEATGHHFPGGARDLRDTWLEVTLHDANGKMIAQSGADHEKTGTDTDAHIFRVHQVDKTGSAQREHNVSHFRVPVFDNTIEPRDARVIRYQLPGLSKKQTPLKIKAVIKHRRVSQTIFDRACKESKTAKGKAFLKGTLKHNGIALKPCENQPVIIINSAARWVVGKGKSNPHALEEWRRMYRHGLALEHQVQENLEEAIQMFNKALKLLPKDAPDLHRAMIMLEIAKVQGRQGRTDESYKTFDKAQKLAPKSPAPAYNRGLAAMQVWRFKDAIKAFEAAVKFGVHDDRVWRQLAIAHGSESNGKQALHAAQRGLMLEPRDPHLLRSQMLSYRQLKAPASIQEQADKAFEVHKRDIEASQVKSKCSTSAQWCKRERVPVHVHVLKPVKK